MKSLLTKIWQLIFGKPKIEVKPIPPRELPKIKKQKRWKLKKCIVMDKYMFTREQAQQKKDEHLKKSKDKYLRIYLCQFCAKWHLTHKKGNRA